jgi:hypothetical protein
MQAVPKTTVFNRFLKAAIYQSAAKAHLVQQNDVPADIMLQDARMSAMTSRHAASKTIVGRRLWAVHDSLASMNLPQLVP